MQHNVRQYLTYQRVDEVFIFNNNPRVNLREIPLFRHKKIALIQSSKDLGFTTRFAAAGLASNQCILFADDDLFIPEPTVDMLSDYWEEDPRICHGTQGRFIYGDRYNGETAFGQVHVVLTRCLAASKRNCLEAFYLSNEFLDLDRKGEPRGNGEDIILSYVSMSNAGRFNRAYNLAYQNFKEDSRISTCLRFKDHYDHRSKVVQRCQQLLPLTGIPNLRFG